MKITIETIPHDQQRYCTAGDWIEQPGGDILIRVSELGDWRYNMAVGIHEAVEALLCRNDGVSQADVDAFDMAFSEDQPIPWASSEPGDERAAPYARQHCFATAVERMLIGAFGLSWADYEAAVEALP